MAEIHFKYNINMHGLRRLAALLMLFSLTAISVRGEDLKLMISVQQQTVVAANPIRITLQFHNSGARPLWLYRPIQNTVGLAETGNEQIAEAESNPNRTFGGSALQIQLTPATGANNAATELAARATVLLTQGLPHPRLVYVAPGKDFDERVSVQTRQAQMATGQQDQFAQGHFQLSVTYSAQYSNQDELDRDLGAGLWHGELKSNSVPIDLEPPTGTGSIEGTVAGQSGNLASGILVTLSDENEESLDQVTSGADGSFSFTHLPWGRYWITARLPEASEDTSVFRHFDLDSSTPHASAQLMLLATEPDKSSQLLHKPVLFRVVDAAGHPIEGIKLNIVWSNGLILENAKTETNEDGTTALSLLPGSNFVTLARHGCQDADSRADVKPGPGVDGFKLTFECSAK